MNKKKDKNTLLLHIIAALIATYAEKGYYLRVKGLLLIGKKVTTYRQKGYYLSPTHLFVSSFSPTRTVLESYFVPEQM